MITRAQMPRQLRNKGGITNVVPRTNYLLGGIKRRIRKLIPNELADVAVKAAPFVAMIPGYGPATAALMRGIGRFDQRGSLSDAFKQGLGTFAGGKLFGAGMEKIGLRDPGAKGIGEFFSKGTRSKAGSLFEGGGSGKKITAVGNKKTGPLEKVAERVFENVPFSDKLPTVVKEKLLVGGITSAGTALYEYFTGGFEPQQPGESMEEYMARRRERVKSQMRQVMDSYYTPLRNPSYAAMSDEEKNNFIDGIVGQGMATGGRVGYQTGGITMANTLAENIRRNLANQAAISERLQQARRNLEQQLPGRRAAQFQIEREANRIAAEELNRMTGGARGNPGGTSSGGLSSAPTMSDIQAAIAANRNVNRIQTGPQPGELDPLGLPMSMTMLGPLSGSGSQSLAEIEATRKRIEAAQAAMKPTYEEALMGESWETLSDNDQYRLAMEYPGETPPRRNPNFVPGLAKGGMPVGIMRTNKAGVIERDYRDKGGFVPVGIKEKADDVPAMLSKNEFVFTADAVRGAGNGSIEKGAQKMYDTMKKLEKRVV